MTKIFIAIFAPDERLPSSATLLSRITFQKIHTIWITCKDNFSRNTNYLDNSQGWLSSGRSRLKRDLTKNSQKCYRRSLLLKVEFLNSVIVDMQRKNDDLKTKLELYESAGILDESVDFIFNGVSSRLKTNFFSNRLLAFFLGRAVPPRLFCDICDEFDLHDTEDCPTQVWHHSKVLCCCFSLSFHFKIFHT